MKRYTGQKALYEAIARTQAKLQRRGILERLHPGNEKEKYAQPPVVEEPEPQVGPVKAEAAPAKPPVEKPVVEKLPAPVVRPVRPVEHPEPQPRPAQRWLRPKAIQLHDGHIEISVPYTIGVTVLLVAILLVLGAFRLGQMQHRYRLPEVTNTTSSPVKQPTPKMNPEPVVRQEPPTPVGPGPENTPANTDAGGSAAIPVKKGDHVIVLAQLSQREPLDTAREYFTKQGIATSVVSIPVLRDLLNKQGISTRGLSDRGGFMLVTDDYYDNPQNPGTNGYQAKQRIIEVGRGYKAKSGSDSFAPNYFSDAYGMKVR
jgi:hypothetical protein